MESTDSINPTPQQQASGNQSTDGEAGSPAGPRRRPLVVTAGLALLAGIALLAVLFVGDDASGSADPLALPFVYEDGTTGSLADFDGQPVVVNFFAAWCAPCRAEIPDIEAVHLAAGDTVRVIGVSHDLDETTWRSFVAETGLTYPTAFQPRQEIWAALGLVAMPATILITDDGEVVHTHLGRIDQAALRELIAEHLDVRV
jgi:peroxiredoxin